MQPPSPPETLSIYATLGIAGTVIVILLGVAGYFVNRFVTATETSIKELVAQNFQMKHEMVTKATCITCNEDTAKRLCSGNSEFDLIKKQLTQQHETTLSLIRIICDGILILCNTTGADCFEIKSLRDKLRDRSIAKVEI